MEENVDNHPLWDFSAPKDAEVRMGYIVPNIAANDFELKPALINMVSQNQFFDLAHEDPNQHLATFEEIFNTLKMNGVSNDAIKLRVFPFSLRDKAKNWLRSLAPTLVATWPQMSTLILSKYFPPSKTAALRNQITNFKQRDGESLSEAWDRYQELLRLCPHHGLEQWLILQTFYEGSTYNTRMNIDAAAGGSLMSRSQTDAFNLIEEMALNQLQWSSERGTIRAPGRYETDGLTKLGAQMDAMQRKFDQMNVSAVSQF